MSESRVAAVFELLHGRYGNQHWWPADTPFEVMVGALLTQNTNWRNVEKAIVNLKSAGMLEAKLILDCERGRLEELIRPAGFFRQKAERLQILCNFYLGNGGETGLAKRPLKELRHDLLALKGIGPETADSMLLYALHKPIFVVDAYTRRIFSRVGEVDASDSYAGVQRHFIERLPPSLPLYQEYHALIVKHAKEHCRVKPDCNNCPLLQLCAFGAEHVD